MKYIDVIASGYDNEDNFSVRIPIECIVNISGAVSPDKSVLDLKNFEWATLWLQNTKEEILNKIELAKG